MKHEDPRAENLFHCLASYTPRPDRNATEDFCTETLAWCLRNSPEFRVKFLQSLQPIKDELKDVHCVAIVCDTQRFFELAEGDKTKGRLDMVVESADGCAWVALFEDKVNADFKKGQLPKYRRELDSDRYKDFAGKFLITLTKSEISPQGVDGHISWAKVHDALENIPPQISPSADEATVTIICKQFAQYLKQEGMVPMQIPKIKKTEEFTDGILFHEAAERLFSDFQKDASDEVKNLLKSKAGFHEYKGYKVIRCDNRDGPYFCAGITVCPSFGLYVEGCWLKKPLNDDVAKKHVDEKLPKSSFWSDSKMFGIDRPIDNDLDGNRDKMLEWFSNAISLVLQLREGKLS